MEIGVGAVADLLLGGGILLSARPWGNTHPGRPEVLAADLLGFRRYRRRRSSNSEGCLQRALQGSVKYKVGWFAGVHPTRSPERS